MRTILATRLCGAPAHGAGHAGDVRLGRQGDREPDPGHLRRVRLVRDAAAGGFPGLIADSVLAQSALVVACAVLICLGTLASRSPAVAAVAMAVVGFAVLFAGVVSSVLAGATTSLLLAFILPVSLPGPVSSIPDRLAGWGLAGAVSLLAIALLWPSPARDPVRVAAVAACRALAARLRAEIAWDDRPQSGPRRPTRPRSGARRAGRGGLQRDVLRHPIPADRPEHGQPGGHPAGRRAALAEHDRSRSTPRRPARPGPGRLRGQVAAAEVLCKPRPARTSGASTEDLHAAVEQMRDALASLEMATTSRLPEPDESAADEDLRTEGRRARGVVSALDPSFRAQELSFSSPPGGANTTTRRRPSAAAG